MKNTFLFIFTITFFCFQNSVEASKKLRDNQVDVHQKALSLHSPRRSKIHKNYALRLKERKESSKLVSKKLKLIKKVKQ